MDNIFEKTFVYNSWSGDEVIDIVNAIESKSINRVIVVGPQEHTVINPDQNLTYSKIFEDYLKLNNVEYVRIVGAPTGKKWNPNYNMTYKKNVYSWEMFFAHATVMDAVHTGVVTPPLGHTNIKKHFITLNRKAHPHRCLFIDMLHKHNLQDFGFVTWHDYQGNFYNYEFKHWQPTKLKIEEGMDVTNDDDFKLFKPPAQFQESLFSVICESTEDIIFVTEKTFMPIYHKRPFLIFGAKNTHSFLKKYNFRLFDEIIDYSFDSVDDTAVRYNMTMVELKKICDMDPYYLLDLLMPKIEHNYKNMLTIFKDQIGVDPAIFKLVEHDLYSMEYYKTLLTHGNTNHFNNLYKTMIQGII